MAVYNIQTITVLCQFLWNYNSGILHAKLHAVNFILSCDGEIRIDRGEKQSFQKQESPALE